MTIGRYNPRSRYRERHTKRMNAILMTVAVVAAFAGIGFWLGRQHAVFQIESLKKDAESAQADAKRLQDELIKVTG